MSNSHDASTPHLNATVKASAGVGKTYLLVTRLVRLLLAGAKPDSILAITFTRKAAAEIQTRLAERAFELAACNAPALAEKLRALGMTDTPENRDLARNLYERLLRAEHPVRTSTFHAFCQDVLRRFPLEADVPPGFELMEKEGAYARSAWDALFAEATHQPDGDLAQHLGLLFEQLGGLAAVETALLDFLGHRSDWWAYTDRAEDPVAMASERLRQQLGIDPDVDPMTDFFSPTVEEELKTFALLLARHETKTNLKHADLLARALSPLEQMSDAERRSLVWAAFFTTTGTPIKRKEGGPQKKAMGETGQAQFLALHESFCTRLLELKERQAKRNTYRASAAWFASGARLLDYFQHIKREQRLLDFNDLEWKAYQLLSNSENALWVQYKLDQRIEHLLVDEFQDTNPSQWQLLLPLLQEMAAGERKGRSVFLVGDGKQSIYGFRRADPRLLHTASQWLAENLAAENFPLDTSWRSAPAIMDFVNLIFGEGELNGLLPGFQTHRTHLAQLWGRVEVLPLIEPEEPPEAPAMEGLRNPLQAPRVVHFDERHYREGQLIAQRIEALRAQPVLVGGDKQARPLRYSDVLILVRNRTHLHDYEQALRDAGIPYQGANRGTLLDSLEIQDMVALLDILMMPHNNLSLATVLRSPLFAASDEDLMVLAQSGDGPWINRLAAVGPAQPAGSPLERGNRWLAHWRTLAGQVPVHDLLDKIYSEGDLVARYEAAFPPHLRRRVRGNLVRFIELALEIDSGRYPSIGRFLTRLEEWQQAADDAPDEAAPEADEDCVRVMTIHGAKGLEAPVVFLAGAVTGNKANRAHRAMIAWPSGQPRPEHFLLVGKKDDQDALSRELTEAQGRREREEEANLLYVAVTRARQMLLVTGSRPSRGKDLGWYGQIVAQLPERTETEGFVLETGAMPARAATPVAASETPRAEPDPRLARPLATSGPVREIAPSRTAEEESGEDVGGRERGIAIHRFLELLSEDRGQDSDALLRRVAGELGMAPDMPPLADSLAEAQAVVANPALAYLFNADAYTTAYNEVPIQYDLDGRTVYGLVDRLIVADDDVILVDYKTHRNASRHNLAAIARQYEQQMWLYANGVRRLWPGRKLRGLLLFTACGLTYEMDDLADESPALTAT